MEEFSMLYRRKARPYHKHLHATSRRKQVLTVDVSHF